MLRPQAVTEEVLKFQVFSDVTLCRWGCSSQCFKGTKILVTFGTTHQMTQCHVKKKS